MKKILFSVFVLILIFACKKENLDPEYPFTIVVETYDDSVAVNNVKVEVSAPVQGNTVALIGYTNEAGKVSFKYDLDAVLFVRATRGSNPITYMGCTDIRLEPDQNVTKHIYLEQYDPALPGCIYTP